MEYYFTYFIVFKSNENGFSGPIVLFRNLESVKKNTNGTMHLLDDDLNGTLGAIEYIMHLPRNEFDVYDLDEEFMASSYDTPHQIVLVPDYVLVNLKIDNIAPTMFILTEDCSKDIKNNCEKRKPLLGTYYTHELSQELIKKQWEKIWLSKRTNDFEFEAVKDINISKLSENDKEKEYKIFNWVMLGLFSNICKEITDNIENPPMVRYIYNSNIIFSNYRLNNPLQICLENYIIGICSLESLYKKLNIEILGISKEDFQKVIRRIENDNSNKIHAFRTIFSNIDLIMRFHEYCWKNRQSKESGNKDERGKTRAVVDRFFRNIERFYREYIDKNFEEKLNNLILRDSDGEEAVINISELYADLLQRSIEESVSFEEKQKQDKVKEMMDSLDFDVQPDEPLQSVSTYLKNKSAENVLKNVKNIIHNMKRYQVRHKAGFIIMREYAIDYYQRVAEFWVENPKLDIPEEMSKEYKDRAVERNWDDNRPVSLEDFKSYFELGKKPKRPRGVGGDITKDPHYYGVSSFLDRRIVEQKMKFPNPKKKLAAGYVYSAGGPQDTREEHVCWWLYTGADVSGFKLIEEH